MLARGVQFRNVIATFLVAAIPFCCCNVRTLLGADLSCPASSSAADGFTGGRHAAAVDRGAAPRACCHGRSSSQSDSPTPTPAHGPADDTRDCSCEKAVGKMLTLEKPSVELPGDVLAAILVWCVRPELPALDVAGGPEPHHRAVARPATSLVRLHCALIV